MVRMGHAGHSILPLAPPAYVVGIVVHLPRTTPLSPGFQGRKETYGQRGHHLFPGRDLPHLLHAQEIRFDPI